MSTSKADIRLAMEKWRMELSKEDIEAASRAIFGQLYGLIPWQTISNVHCYVAMPERNEIDTSEILNQIWKDHPHIVTSVPIIRSKTMLACTVTPSTRWQTGPLGTQEPVEITMSTASTYDIIIVPMLAYNEAGYRIGYGKGYYDKFLVTQPDALKIGLCYDANQVEFTPEPHDVPLDVIITESKTMPITR